MRIGTLVTLLVVALTGCAGFPGGGTASNVVHVEVAARDGSRLAQRGGPATRLRVAEFTDARNFPGTRKIGNVRATVRDMFGTELVLDRNVESLITEASRTQLAGDGLSLVGADKEADFTVEGAVKAFSLDIAGRDERKLAVEVTLREAQSGRIVATELIEEHDDRYAGVMGNSRATIAAYLESGVAAYSARLGAMVQEHLPKARTGSAEVIVAPVADVAVSATGRFSVQTVPPHARIYVGDVYYGQSPLRLDLPAGIAAVTFKLSGYRTVTEKVSIRTGETTELELPLEKQ